MYLTLSNIREQNRLSIEFNKLFNFVKISFCLSFLKNLIIPDSLINQNTHYTTKKSNETTSAQKKNLLNQKIKNREKERGFEYPSLIRLLPLLKL